MKRDLKYLLTFILFGSVIRILFWTYSPVVGMTPDSDGYHRAGRQILQTYQFVDHSRPPVYPIVIHLPSLLTGKFPTPFESPDFLNQMKVIIVAQSVAGIAGAGLIYYIARRLHLPPLPAGIAAVISHIQINSIGNEHFILTEAFSTFFFSLFTYVSILLIQKSSVRLWILLWIIAFIASLLKPAFLPFLAIPCAIKLLTHLSKRTVIAVVCVMCLYCAGVYLYMQRNEAVTGYKGFSRISDINLLGKIIYDDIPIESAKEYSFYYDALKKYRASEEKILPYRILEIADPRIYENNARFNELNLFTTTVIRTNLPYYTYTSLTHIPEALLEPNGIIQINNVDSFLHPLFRFIKSLSDLSQYMFFILFPAYGILLVMWLRRRTVMLGSYVLVFTTGLCQIFMSVFFSYNEYGRLISIALPVLTLMVVICLYQAVQRFKIYIANTA